MYDETRYRVAVANRVLAKVGLCTGVTAAVGHASMRVPERPEYFVVKGRGYDIDALAVMNPDDMIVCDLDGYKVEGRRANTQCYEIKMHSCIYKMYPDVQAVVHAHPKFTVLMSTLNVPVRPVHKGASHLVEQPLPIYPHAANVLTEEEGTEVAELLASSNAVLLKSHGATTKGSTLSEAVTTMANIEAHAQMNWYACCAVGPDYPSIPPSAMLEIRRNGDTERISQLDHFKESIAAAGGLPIVNGIWQYYADIAEREMRRVGIHQAEII